MNLRDLTKGERLLIDRRRRGESQAEAAERLGLSVYAYRRFEEDVAEGPTADVEALELGEACYLERRREGLPASWVAERVGVSRWWLTQMERGREDADRLGAWWRSRGARFPRKAPAAPRAKASRARKA